MAEEHRRPAYFQPRARCSQRRGERAIRSGPCRHSIGDETQERHDKSRYGRNPAYPAVGADATPHGDRAPVRAARPRRMREKIVSAWCHYGERGG